MSHIGISYPRQRCQSPNIVHRDTRRDDYFHSQSYYEKDRLEIGQLVDSGLLCYSYLNTSMLPVSLSLNNRVTLVLSWVLTLGGVEIEIAPF